MINLLYSYSTTYTSDLLMKANFRISKCILNLTSFQFKLRKQIKAMPLKHNLIVFKIKWKNTIIHFYLENNSSLKYHFNNIQYDFQREIQVHYYSPSGTFNHLELRIHV